MRRVRILIALSLVLGLVPASAAGPDDHAKFEAVDYGKVARRIAKEPKYVADPLYALFLFGPKGDMKVWAVLDKSDAKLPHYDVVYLDKNADGDLTSPKERFQGSLNPKLARAGVSMWISTGNLAVAGTNEVHENLRFATIPKAGRKGVWFSMMWRGKEKVAGGSARTGYDSTVWAPTAAKAPVLRPTVEGPLGFAIWGGPQVPVLRIGGETKISFMAGNSGSGPDTLCYVSDGFLVPGKDRIFATVIARDRKGKKLEVRSEIRGKPC
jgi:hypothetical protein